MKKIFIFNIPLGCLYYYRLDALFDRLGFTFHIDSSV